MILRILEGNRKGSIENIMMIVLRIDLEIFEKKMWMSLLFFVSLSLRVVLIY